MCPAVAADHQHGDKDCFPAGEEGEVWAHRTDLLDHAHHESEIAGGVLDADDAGELVGQAADGGHVDGAGKHGDVVEGEVDGGVAGDLGEVGVDGFGGELVVEGGDDGDGARAHVGV